jgi:aldose sugar dehydrogenase
MVISALIILFLCLQNNPSYGKISIYDPSLKAELITSGLKSATSMSFLGKNDLLVLEQQGVVKRVIGNKTLEIPPLNITSIVNSTRERGLLGIAIPNGEAENQDKSHGFESKIYLYYTEKITNQNIDHKCANVCNKNERIVNSLYEYELRDGRLVKPILLIHLPMEEGDIGLEHVGGKIVLGPDKRLYISTGDSYPCRSLQDCRQAATSGKLYAKTANSENGTDPVGFGGIIALPLSEDSNHKYDYPFGNSSLLSLYYAYGIRNSFGLDFDPITGILWDTENGPFFGDEINLVEPGFNSGWAKIQGIWPITNYYLLIKDAPRPGYFPNGSMQKFVNGLYDFEGKGKYSSPEVIWKKSIGITALKFFNSNKLGDNYKNQMFVGSFNKGFLYHFELSPNRKNISFSRELPSNVIQNGDRRDLLLARGFIGITDLQVSPDGYLYILTYDGNIWKITKSSTK